MWQEKRSVRVKQASLAAISINPAHAYFIHSEDRVRNGAKKLQKSKQKATQGRLDMFFKPVGSPISGQKRKVLGTELVILLNVVEWMD